MIIYRLAEGRGWEHESMGSSATFTTMQLNDERVQKIELPGMHIFADLIPPTCLILTGLPFSNRCGASKSPSGIEFQPTVST